MRVANTNGKERRRVAAAVLTILLTALNSNPMPGLCMNLPAESFVVIVRLGLGR
jgi:hypothetical protein